METTSDYAVPTKMFVLNSENSNPDRVNSALDEEGKVHVLVHNQVLLL